jgi:hypothetical protein
MGLLWDNMTAPRQRSHVGGRGTQPAANATAHNMPLTQLIRDMETCLPD